MPDDLSGTIQDTKLADALSERYLAYALSTIMSRSLPDVRDGLKPVHRRLIYAMHQLKLDPAAGFKKCARVVGDVIGKYHPHGDAAVYEALVRLAQDFAARYPLVEGQGNFGNVDGDNPAAMRYTEARLTEVAQALLAGIDDDAVDFRPTYDGEESEPVVLPGGFPNLLANGAAGIAVGMATSIPPHNAGEVCAAAIHLIQHPDATTAELLEHMPGPDFPTGGILVESRDAMLQAYETGRGGFRIRAKWEVQRGKLGMWQVIVTEIPYQVQKSKLIEQVAELLEAKKLPFLGDIRDESTDEIRLVLEPKSRGVEPEVLMETLFRATQLETRFSLNMNVLTADHTPTVLGLRGVLRAWLDHRHEVLERRSRHRLAAIQRRLEVLDGYLAVFLNLDEVIRIIREEDQPKPALIARFTLTDVQAEAILNMRLRSLRRLEEMEIRKEHKALTREGKEIGSLLKDESTALGEDRRRTDGDQSKVRRRQARRPPHGPGRRPRRRRGQRRAPDRARADHRHPVAEGLDPRRPRPSRRRRRAQVQGGRRAPVGRALPDHRPPLPGRAPAAGSIRCAPATFRGAEATASRSASPPRWPTTRRSRPCSSGRRAASYLIASDAGRGFRIAAPDLLAEKRTGKQVLNLKPGEAVLLCVPAEGDHVACVGTNRKLLVFPLDQVPELARGAGVMLQKYRDGKLADAKVFRLDDGLTWRLGDKTRTETDLRPWLGTRAQAGRMVPNGFPKSGRFS